MSFKNMIPWRKSTLPAGRPEEATFDPLRTEIDQLFNGFLSAFSPGFDLGQANGGRPGRPAFSPRVNVTEDANTVHVTAELPGVDEKDLEVFVEGGELTIQGDKKEETRKTSNGSVYIERVYGSFRRVIRLPVEVQTDAINAAYKKGVLSISLPKAESAKSRKIDIQPS